MPETPAEYARRRRMQDAQARRRRIEDQGARDCPECGEQRANAETMLAHRVLAHGVEPGPS